MRRRVRRFLNAKNGIASRAPPLQPERRVCDSKTNLAHMASTCFRAFFVFRRVFAIQFVVGFSPPPPPLWLKLLIGILLHQVSAAIMGDHDAKRSKRCGDGVNLCKACKSDPSSLQPPTADVVTERNPSLHTPLHCCAIMDRLDAACVRHVLEFCCVSPRALHNGIACCSRRLNICWRNHHRRIVLIFTAVVIEALDRLEPMIGVAVGNLEDIL